MNAYNELNKKLQELLFARKSRPKIAPIEKIYHQLNLPKMKMIHIGGTNGKGSVSEKISASCTLSGYKTGRYTSPHLETFRERIAIDGRIISEEEVEVYLPPLLKYSGELTFFEICTLLALVYFASKNVEVAVIEVGLGGRFDATNCIAPLLSVITSISLDHQHLLGETLEEIAFEKAGIIKRNTPVILGPTATQNIFKIKAQEIKAPFQRVKGSFENYDLENQATAKAALKELQKSLFLSEKAIEEGLLKRPPCRFEKVIFQKREILLDVAHNEAGLKALFRQIQKEYPKRKLIVFFSLSIGHDLRVSKRTVEEAAQEIYCLQSDHPRLLFAKDLQKGFVSAKILPIEQVVEKIMQLDPNALFICTGTFFIMGPIREQLKLQKQRDPYLIQDGSFNFSGSIKGGAPDLSG